MTSTSEEWSTNANDAVNIELVQPPSKAEGLLTLVHAFHPRFTYPIYGEEERIFGYKGLKINLKFAAHDLQPHVTVSYDKKFPPVGTTTAQDILKPLKAFLPTEAFGSQVDFEQNVIRSSANKTFKPPGSLVKTYERSGRHFEIWAGSLLHQDVRETVERMQILVSLYIEAGTPINTEDVDWTLDRWRVYFLYEKIVSDTPSISPYIFAGYATTYRFYNFIPSKSNPSESALVDYPPKNPITFTQIPSRLRISQFLILPPYEKAGNGSALYQSIYAEVMADPTIKELTVEDPSEEFDKLRDTNDWKVLEPKFREVAISIDTSISEARIRKLPTARLLSKDTLKAIRASTKIASRQFARQVEMYLLSLIPHSHRAAGGANLTRLKMQKHRTSDLDAKKYYWWRLLVKQRILKKNKDVLEQMDLEDRLPKIEESARAQEDEYEQLLLAFATSVAKEILQNGSGSSSRERKRKVVDDEEDEDEDEDHAVGGIPERKKVRS